jgi:DNA polymerase III delta prime subunit
MTPTPRDRLLTFVALFFWSSVATGIATSRSGGGHGTWSTIIPIASLFEFFVVFWPACDHYFQKGKEGVRQYWTLVAFILLGSLIGFFLIPWLAFLGFIFVPMFIFNTVKGNTTITVRGRQEKSSAEIRSTYDQVREEGDTGYLWGGVAIPSQKATTHFLVAGASGSGKTLTLRLLMQSMLSKIEEGSDNRALIYDAKRDILSIIAGINNKCPVWILNPFDERCVAWEIGKDITTYAQVESLASILVPKGEKDDEFFLNATKQCLQGVVEVFMENGSGQWELRDILLAMRNKYTLGALLASSPNTEDCLEYLTNNDVMLTIKSKIGKYRVIAALWHRAKTKISLTEWSKSNGILVMGKDNEAKDALDALNQVIFTRVAQLLLNKPEVKHPQHFIILDELASLGKLNQLKELAEEGRSKGVCLAIGFQSIKSLEDAYNEKVAKAITGQFEHKAFLKLNEAATAEWASKLIGTAEIVEPTISTTFSKDGKSYTRGEIRKIINAVEPSELLGIAPLDETLNIGLTGYYLVGHGLYNYTYSINFITKNLLPKSSTVQDFIPAPDSYQKLEDWTDEDLHRLGIYHILNPEIDDLDE